VEHGEEEEEEEANLGVLKIQGVGQWPFLVLFLGKNFSHQMSKRNATRILNSSSVNGLDEDDDDKQTLEEYIGERNKRVRDESVLVRV